MGKELLDGANWTHDMDTRYDTLTGPGGVPDDVARLIVLQEAGLRVYPNRTAPKLSAADTDVSHGEIMDAAQRVVGDETNGNEAVDEEDDVPQPAAPKPGETDEQIRQRHRDALKSRGEPIDPDSTGQAA